MMTHLIADRFTALFGRPPTHVARAPGRVNLIGEHTDYNGLPVLPMAVEREVRIAAAPRDDRRVRLANVDSRFGERAYELSPNPEPWPAGDWGNYHKAASRGLLEWLGDEALRGGDFLVDGDVPPGAGLSSSAAFVVASALALLAANGGHADPRELAERMALAERYVGALSGGMDQAACLLARAGHALRIDFDPLRAEHVPVRPGCSFVVCHSLVRAEKSGAARAAYNQRVLECREACRRFEQALGLSEPLRHLGDLRGRFAARDTRQLVAALREAGAGETVVRRVRHVLDEAGRVELAQEALARGDWEAMGGLMDASHASCRDDYEVSCPELDELVAAARRAGALGSRLTGAGFGGCTVNLVRAGAVPAFLREIEEIYYRPRAPVPHEHCFVFTPCQGAEVRSL